MRAHFYVLDNDRETEKLIFVTSKLLTSLKPPPPSYGPVYLYTKNTSDYEQEPPRTLVPLQIGWNEFDFL